MKNKVLILVSFALLIVSCWGYEDPEGDRFGFTFKINNNTDVIFTDASITIGGMKDGEFIGTETYNFPTLTITGNNEWDTYNGNEKEDGLLRIANSTNGGRWNPDLDLIRNIPSEKFYFKLTLAVDNETLLQSADDDGVLTNLISREIPEEYIVKNNDGALYIGIWEEGIISSLKEN